jgi:hypothetical protein
MADYADAAKVKVTRSAKHSKFPECKDCQTKRYTYVELRSNPLANEEKVQEAYDDLLQHQKEWSADRAEAIKLRYASYLPGSNDLYECDDKCGSFWQQLPVAKGGRSHKGNDKQVYSFAVQANVICGDKGVMQLSIVPKTVKTGRNFGLSTLLKSLAAAHRIGRMGPNVTRLVRHTDGGPDNLSKATHIFHWLLVYLGVFQEVLWFRFESGHSHTEIADRLFSLMKKLFETDSAARVRGGVHTFPQLEEHLKHVFAKCPEMKEIVYHFANWDMVEWLETAVHHDEDHLKYISFDNVFRYEYVAESGGSEDMKCLTHGGVRVTFKKRLSMKPSNHYDAEWAPIERVSVTTATGEVREANRTTAAGVRFVACPPDLRKEPGREDLILNEKQQSAAAKAAETVSKRADLPPEDQAFWAALSKLHQEGKRAESVPNMPHSIDANGKNFSFDGSPVPMLPVLKQMAFRFKRPYITWDVWSEPPPPEFPITPSNSSADPNATSNGSSGGDDNRGTEDVLPDPRHVNSVRHLGNKAEWDLHRQQMLRENWADEREVTAMNPAMAGKLCIVKLYPADGELCMGLVEAATGQVRNFEQVQKFEAKWFARTSKKAAWGQNPEFNHWNKKVVVKKKADNKSRGKDNKKNTFKLIRDIKWVAVDSILYVVKDEDLTEKSRATHLDTPKFTQEFTRRLYELAKTQKLLASDNASDNGSQDEASDDASNESEASDDDMCDEPDASDDDSNASRGHEDENMDDDEEEWDEDDELNDQVADHEEHEEVFPSWF